MVDHPQIFLSCFGSQVFVSRDKSIMHVVLDANSLDIRSDSIKLYAYLLNACIYIWFGILTILDQ